MSLKRSSNTKKIELYCLTRVQRIHFISGDFGLKIHFTSKSFFLNQQANTKSTIDEAFIESSDELGKCHIIKPQTFGSSNNNNDSEAITERILKALQVFCKPEFIQEFTAEEIAASSPKDKGTKESEIESEKEAPMSPMWRVTKSRSKNRLISRDGEKEGDETPLPESSNAESDQNQKDNSDLEDGPPLPPPPAFSQSQLPSITVDSAQDDPIDSDNQPTSNNRNSLGFDESFDSESSGLDL